MHVDKIDKYFSRKNLDVSFDTLGSTQALVDLFVSENSDAVKESFGKISNHVKHLCYTKYYPNMQERTKFTGFEKFDLIDKQLRIKMNKHVTGMLGMTSKEVKVSEYMFGTYLEELKNSFKKFKNPLLYMSGGIDSEFVANAMLDAKINFTPVIFQWSSNTDQIFNIHDILYALDFCNEHNLTPIIRKINLENLWTNPDFELMAKETNISSPQINTYIYMIELMSEEFKDSTHVLGGEVRFKTVINEENNKVANFVLAAKEPAGNLAYNAANYVNRRTSSTWPSTLTINFIYNYDGVATNNQTWEVTGNATLFTFSGTYTGNWYIGESGGGTGFEYSTNGGSSWSNLNVGANTISTLSLSPGATATNSTTVNLQVRNKSAPQITISSSITIQNEYVYVPSLITYSSSSTYVVPNGVSSIEVLMVGGGGGGSGASDSYPAEAGAGGGGGEVIYNSSYAVTSGQTITITVGNGGSGGSGTSYGLSGGGNNGSSTSISGGTGGTLTADGGGGSRGDVLNPSYYVDGGNAGNGIYTGGLGDSVSSTIRGGGGAGDSEDGGGIGVAPASPKGGDGGDGTLYVIGGTSVTLGGGGGGTSYSGPLGTGGAGGGAAAVFMSTNGGTAPSGTANTGGGGASAMATLFGGQTNNGGSGGTGVVYIYG